MGCLRNILIGLLVVALLVVGVGYFFYSSASYVYKDLDVDYDQEDFAAISERIEPPEAGKEFDAELSGDEIRTLILGNLQRRGLLKNYVSGLGVQLSGDAMNVKVNADLSRLKKRLPFFLDFIIRKDTVSFQGTLAPELQDERILMEVREFKLGKLGLPVGRVLAFLEGPLSAVDQIDITEGGRLVVDLPQVTVRDLSLSEEALSVAVTGSEGSKSDQEEDADKEEQGEKETGEEIKFDNFATMTSISQFIDRFQQLKWSYQGDSFQFTFEGTEEIEGTEAEKVVMEVGDKGTFVAWIDEESDELVQVKAKGEIITEGASEVWSGMKGALFMPFKLAQSTLENFIEYEGEGTVFHYTGKEGTATVEVERTGTETVGELECETYAVHAELQGEEGTLHLGDFGDFQMIIRVEKQGETIFEAKDIQLK